MIASRTDGVDFSIRKRFDGEAAAEIIPVGAAPSVVLAGVGIAKGGKGNALFATAGRSGPPKAEAPVSIK